MTGSASDPLDWQPHIRNKPRREALADAVPATPTTRSSIVIVRDMWLTGFDAPCLHTMYVDKPMRGHGLMQAIARVNRVFKDKPGGLVVDYLGLADELKQALATYTESGGTGKTAIDQDEAVAVMLEKYEICRGLFHGFDWSRWMTGTPQERLSLLPAAQEHILAQEDGKDRLLQRGHRAVAGVRARRAARRGAGAFATTSASSRPCAPCSPRARRGERKTDEELDHAIRQIVSQAVASDEVVDIFAAAGLKKPDISILSDEFLAEVRGMPQRNLAVELLRKLLHGEIKTRSPQERRPGALLRRDAGAGDPQVPEPRHRDRAGHRGADRSSPRRCARRDARGEELGPDRGRARLLRRAGDQRQRRQGARRRRRCATIARELVETVRSNVTIDWTVRENVRAQLRVLVKRILRKYGYPPDKQEKATQTVLEQAEVLSGAGGLGRFCRRGSSLACHATTDREDKSRRGIAVAPIKWTPPGATQPREAADQDPKYAWPPRGKAHRARQDRPS